MSDTIQTDVTKNETTKKKKKGFSFRGCFLKFLFIFLLFAAGYIYYSYFYHYSDGIQPGYVMKFSHKGKIFKTWEGYIIDVPPNAVMPDQSKQSRNQLYFTVKNDHIAKQIEQHQNQKVKLHYVQYLKNLPWRGENYNDLNFEDGQYIVDSVMLDETNMYQNNNNYNNPNNNNYNNQNQNNNQNNYPVNQNQSQPQVQQPVNNTVDANTQPVATQAGENSYLYNDGKLVIRLNTINSQWTARIITVSGLGSDYDNQHAVTETGVVNGNKLFDKSQNEVGTVSQQSVMMTVGDKTVTLVKN